MFEESAAGKDVVLIPFFQLHIDVVVPVAIIVVVEVDGDDRVVL